MWIQPRKWQQGDLFNAVDYNRIKNNVRELWELALSMYPEFSIDLMGPDKAPEDESFFADEMSLLENNLGKLRDHLPYWKGETKSWYENTPFLTIEELNRIENACLQLHEYLMGQSRGRPRLQFTLGRGRCVACR
jgi:hypothetical protein